MPLTGPPLKSAVPPADVLRFSLQTKPDEPALVAADRKWTWRELDSTSSRLAANYLSLGLSPGDRVASLMPNRGELIIHYLACLKAGLVSTPLNYRYQAPEIDHALEVSGAAIILAHAERDNDLALTKLVDRLPLGRVTYDATSGRTPKFEELLESDPQNSDLPSPALSMPSFIYFTSGSTGKPKGVTHTHETLGWMIAATIPMLELKPTDILLPGSSISHIAGSLFSLAGLAAGARVDVARRIDGDELLPLLRSTRPTKMVMLPAALFSLIRDHNATGDDFRSVALCISGGDKVSAELEREYTALAGHAIDESYGMSEIGITTLNPPSGENRIGSIGKLGNGYEGSVRADDGTEVPPDVEGRLWIKSPCTMVGYWNRPDATAETIIDGWLDTGDMMTYDSEGYLWFRGRKKQIIVHDGSNICPQEIEESLLEHPAVQDAGVIGIHDLIHGENVRAYITLRLRVEQPTVAELIKFSRARVGYKAPEEIIVLDEMPLNATGKVDRVRLKQMAEASIHGE